MIKTILKKILGVICCLPFISVLVSILILFIFIMRQELSKMQLIDFFHSLGIILIFIVSIVIIATLFEIGKKLIKGK